LLDYLNHMDIESGRTESDPDDSFTRDGIEKMALRVRELLEGLSDDEREIVRLRYEEGWTAQRIAEERGLSGQRRVYTILDGALRKLRRLIDREGGD
jgi:RNA polymerase sigma factor (sigma-70 family)